MRHLVLAALSKNVLKLLKACEERVSGVMEICGISVDGDATATKIESMAASPGSAQHVFWHSGLSAAAADPLDGEPITEGPGESSYDHSKSEGIWIDPFLAFPQFGVEL